MIAGVLVIDKPSGPTSHDIVARARRALGERRIGHCGTLDPMATGVLALAIGPATRLVQYLTSDEKSYDAVIRFGRTTDTYDAVGTVVSESPARPSREDLEAALVRFRGTFDQVPPAYSAKKIDGVRAYAIARRDPDLRLALAPVRVTVHALDIAAFDGDVATVALRVSAGFYVRSLAHDLGQALGMGAVLEGLRRTSSGSFTLAQACPGDDLQAEARDALVARVVPLEHLLPAVPAVRLTDAEVLRVRHGQDVASGGAGGAKEGEGGAKAPPYALVRMLGPDGRLVALAVPAKRPGFLHPSPVLG